MTFSSNDLWQKISAAGLASPMQCRGWAADAAKGMDVAHTTDGLRMLQQLIDIGKLTKYQAKILAGQSDKPLQRGPWHIRQEVKDPLFAGWLEVIRVDPSKAEQLPVWAKWMQLGDLKPLQESAPSLPRGIQLASVQNEALQTVLIPELQDQELQVQVSPVQGELLATSEFGKGKLSGQERAAAAETIATQIAQALAALHSAGLYHGRVTPDRIYWSGDQATLACDPISVLTSTLDPEVTGLLGNHLPPWTNAHFLAPEFIAPGQPPSISSDIFSFGCTWWWLLTGKPPAQGNNPAEILASQAGPLPELPSDLELAEPYRRVLSHCLARNHTARFSDGGQLIVALQKASAVVQQGKIQQQPTPNPPKTSTAPEPSTNSTDAAARTQANRSTQAKESKPKKVAAVTVQPEHAASNTADGSGKNPQGPKRSSEVNTPTPAAKKRKPQVEPSSNPATDPTPQTSSNPNLQPKPATQSTAVAEQAEPSVAAPKPLTVTSPQQQEPQTAENQTAENSTAPSAPRPSASRRRKRKKRKNKWLVPVFGGLGFLIVLLLVLQLSGALQPSDDKSNQQNARRPVPVIANTEPAEVLPKDPIRELFTLSSSSNGLWAPRFAPEPIDLTMLPPGAGVFVTLRPADLLSDANAKYLFSAFQSEWNPGLADIAARAGVPLENIALCTVALYPPETAGGQPLAAYRIALRGSMALSELKTAWSATAEQKTSGHSLLASPSYAYYVPGHPLVDTQAVSLFSVGPKALMQEVGEFQGGSGPLPPHVEKLWKATSDKYLVSVLADVPFLITEGKGIWKNLPARAERISKNLLGNDTKGLLVQTSLEPSWFYEVRLMGSSVQVAGQTLAKFEDAINELPTKIEQWFVEELPHPHWRYLALKYPQMLRTLTGQSRFGVENGVAIFNGYLPAGGASNLLLTSWKALQDGAMMRADGSGASTNVASGAPPLNIEQFLQRKIRISFDQEPFEEALDMISEEANDGLPSGSAPVRFALNGDAFEAGGITRNFEVRGFSVLDQPARNALTELCKLGNPVPGVPSTNHPDQRVVWTISADPTKPGSKMITLTTRKQATESNIPLPPEFAIQ